MSDQASKSFDVVLREKWDELESAYENRAGIAESDLKIGVSIPRVRDGKESISQFMFQLHQLHVDATYSDSEIEVYEKQDGMLIVATGMMWAKRMLGYLISWEVAFQIEESQICNCGDMLGAREIQFGWSEYN